MHRWGLSRPPTRPLMQLGALGAKARCLRATHMKRASCFYGWFVAQVGYMSATDVSLIKRVQVLWERKQRTNKLRNRSKGVDPYQVPDPYLVLLMCLLVPCVTCSCMSGS